MDYSRCWPIIRAFSILMVYLKGKQKCFQQMHSEHLAINSDLYGLIWVGVITFSHCTFPPPSYRSKLQGDVWGKSKGQANKCVCKKYCCRVLIAALYQPPPPLCNSHSIMQQSFASPRRIWLCNMESETGCKASRSVAQNPGGVSPRANKVDIGFYAQLNAHQPAL